MLAEQNNRSARIPIQVPSTDDHVLLLTLFLQEESYHQSRKQFGIDPLSQSSSLIQRRQLELEQNLPCPREIFAHTVNGDTVYLYNLLNS